ncbi:rbcL, partial [Symbiodinium sp. KB8]
EALEEGEVVVDGEIDEVDFASAETEDEDGEVSDKDLVHDTLSEEDEEPAVENADLVLSRQRLHENVNRSMREVYVGNLAWSSARQARTHSIVHGSRFGQCTPSRAGVCFHHGILILLFCIALQKVRQDKCHALVWRGHYIHGSVWYSLGYKAGKGTCAGVGVQELDFRIVSHRVDQALDYASGRPIPNSTSVTGFHYVTCCQLVNFTGVVATWNPAYGTSVQEAIDFIYGNPDHMEVITAQAWGFEGSFTQSSFAQSLEHMALPVRLQSWYFGALDAALTHLLVEAARAWAERPSLAELIVGQPSRAGGTQIQKSVSAAAAQPRRLLKRYHFCCMAWALEVYICDALSQDILQLEATLSEEAMPEATPVSVAGMNALQLPAFFENLGHSNVILSGGFGHRDGPKAGAISCRQGEEVWKAWKAGQYGNISLNEAVIEFAKTHEELKGAFLTFQKDADEIYPGWREQLTDQSVQATDTASWFWSIFSGLCCMGRGHC